jgi:glycosyltransferase involved in cell wall biosynthesis
MNIAVNTRLLLANKLEGIGWFSYESLKRITQAHPEHHFYFIFDRPYANEFIFSNNITPLIAHPPSRHPVLWYLYFEYGIPYVLRNIKADVFLSTDCYLSLNLKIPSIDVIHDLNFEHAEDFLTGCYKQYCRYFFPKFARKATRIATVSEFSKNDIHRYYKIDKEKIDVVYSGVNEIFKPLSLEEKNTVKQNFTNRNPYFLFVGLIQKRKNLATIFKAFDQYKNGGYPHKLVIVGEKKWWTGEIEDTFLAMKHQDDVIFLGRKSSKELAQLMASAESLLYPSLFEGFGLPIIEAFQSGTPVITSNVSSMPEVAGDAAILVNPYSIDELTAAMIRITNNETLRQSLIEKGHLQRQHFSWDLTAKLLWECIEKAI